MADASPVRQQAVSRCLPQSMIQRSQSHKQDAANDDEAVPDLTDEPAQPRDIVYLESSFSLEGPVHRLKMDERLEVHNDKVCNLQQRITMPI